MTARQGQGFGRGGSSSGQGARFRGGTRSDTTGEPGIESEGEGSLRERRGASPRAGAPGSDRAGRTPQQSAKSYALWLLSRREWSAKELRQRLKLKGYEEPDIEACLALLEQHGLQSDTRFAHSRVRSKASQLGNRRLRQDLAAKGISADLVSESLEEAGDELERARAAARRFEGKAWTPELQAKAWRFLMSRGFGSDAIRQTLKSLKAPLDESFDE